MNPIRECLHWKSEPHPTLGDLPSKMVREAAQEAINAIFDADKPVNPVAVNVPPAFSSSSASVGPPRYEGFGNGNSGGNFQGSSGGNFQSGLKGISGPTRFEEDRSILSYASGAPPAQYGNSSAGKLPGFGNTTSNAAHGFDGSKGIEAVKQVGAKAASILTAGIIVEP
jgi:hypothetical protein